tara:strand:+ start:410 stop:802 length:393 start_codon:yes stop_codon:yes gene_type:complete
MEEKNIISACCLLLSIANADEILDNKEIDNVKEIIIDFFNVEKSNIDNIISESQELLNNSTDIFEFGRNLNNEFSYQDKIDFICCTFEVAFIDGELHYLEEHAIKKISTILNVKHADIIKAKKEIKNYLN